MQRAGPGSLLPHVCQACSARARLRTVSKRLPHLLPCSTRGESLTDSGACRLDSGAQATLRGRLVGSAARGCWKAAPRSASGVRREGGPGALPPPATSRPSHPGAWRAWPRSRFGLVSESGDAPLPVSWASPCPFRWSGNTGRRPVSIPTAQQGGRGASPCPQSPHTLSGSGGGAVSHHWSASLSHPPAACFHLMYD